MSILLVLTVLQAITILIVALQNWVHLPPLTDIRTLEKYRSFKERLADSIIPTSVLIVPFIGTLVYLPGPLPQWLIWAGSFVYTYVLYGLMSQWWLPYFFTTTDEHKAESQAYKTTHHLLPARGDRVVPNTMQVIILLLVVVCWILFPSLRLKG